MAKAKVFVSFDFDNDLDLKTLFCGQAEHPDTPFQIADVSVKQELSGDWKEKARAKIKSADQVVIICGEHTRGASGVSAELKIAQEENKPYFFLWGRSSKDCYKPSGAADSDKIYKWTWENVGALLGGDR